jgi:hypothetical protein
MNLPVAPRFRPALDPEFLPAVLWNRAYRELVARDPGARPFALALIRADGKASVHHDRVLSAGHPAAAHTLRFVERLLKFLLWQKGGCRVLVAGADELAAALAKIYSPTGERAFDHLFMGEKVQGPVFTLAAAKMGAAVGRRFLAHDGPAPRRLPHRLRPRRQRPQGRGGH